MDLKGCDEMKNANLVICIIALITFLTGIPTLFEGITKRGINGVNYGRVIFPLLICCISFWRFNNCKN